MYHRVARASFDPWGLAVDEEHLSSQFEWLARHRSVLPLSKFARLHAERRLPADAIAITFDDGYQSALHHAVPLLQRFRLHATVFLPVEQIERAREFWWDELAAIVLNCDGETLALSEGQVRVPAPDPRDSAWRPDVPPDTPRQVLFYTLWSNLRRSPPKAIEKAMEQLRRQATRQVQSEDAPVAVDALRAVSSNAVHFGSHALTHASLPALQAAEQEREIFDSRERCASLTGAMPTSFAYPYGDFDEGTCELVERAGFLCACSAEHAFVTPDSHPFALPRLRVPNSGASGVRDMLRTG